MRISRMRTLFAVLCCMAPAAASATIYTWVNRDGHVVYSDQPRPGARILNPKNLPPLSFYTPAPATSPTPLCKGCKPHAFLYRRFTVTRPTARATVWNNNGTVDVKLRLVPPLREGDRIVVTVDGQPWLSTRAPRFRLSDLSRGTHVLKATVVNRRDHPEIATSRVTFYLHEASRLSPARRGDTGANDSVSAPPFMLFLPPGEGRFVERREHAREELREHERIHARTDNDRSGFSGNVNDLTQDQDDRDPGMTHGHENTPFPHSP